jgi:hypothetical protein
MNLRSIAMMVLAGGNLLACYVAFFEMSNVDLGLGFKFAVVLSPWVIVDILAIWPRWAHGVLVAGALMLFLEIACYFMVYTGSSGREVGLLYLVKPVFQVACVPIGLISGWLLGKAK